MSFVSNFYAHTFAALSTGEELSLNPMSTAESEFCGFLNFDGEEPNQVDDLLPTAVANSPSGQSSSTENSADLDNASFTPPVMPIDHKDPFTYSAPSLDDYSFVPFTNQPDPAMGSDPTMLATFGEAFSQTAANTTVSPADLGFLNATDFFNFSQPAPAQTRTVNELYADLAASLGESFTDESPVAGTVAPASLVSSPAPFMKRKFSESSAASDPDPPSKRKVGRPKGSTNCKSKSKSKSASPTQPSTALPVHGSLDPQIPEQGSIYVPNATWQADEAGLGLKYDPVTNDPIFPAVGQSSVAVAGKFGGINCLTATGFDIDEANKYVKAEEDGILKGPLQRFWEAIRLWINASEDQVGRMDSAGNVIRKLDPALYKTARAYCCKVYAERKASADVVRAKRQQEKVEKELREKEIAELKAENAALKAQVARLMSRASF
ncbi:hypothetical protein BCR39DRAFT_562859 [Naematelia encephala]|uniref:BZIP domain-containing protein n=1 Tax=Naematelia encephala TaxID=71784 RepID=A0A1Y2AE65_9TREE|nr:hypothetical protein BCR39DRAFT_562859 [Naematelia encephala]